MGTARQFDGIELHTTDEGDPVVARILTLVGDDFRVVDPVAEEHGEPAPVLGSIATLRRREVIYRRWLALADGVAALVAVLAAALLAHKSVLPAIALMPCFAILVAKVEGLYDRDDQVITKTNVGEWRGVMRSATITAMGVYLAWRALTSADSGPGMRTFLFILLVDGLLAILLRAVARRIARATSPSERTLIIGDPNRSRPLAQRLNDAPGVELVGTIREEALTGSVRELQDLVESLDFHRMIISTGSEPDSATLDLIQAAKFIGIRVTLVPSVMTVVGGSALIEELDGMTLLGVPSFGLSRSSAALKRAFDLVVGTLALVALSPLMLVLALAIRLDSRGPALFHQTRIGRHGKPFQILKFRSMVNGADAMKAALMAQNEAADGLFKMVEDPRITRVGRFIRRCHLDELPQLVNVLRGEMSLVGPRPLVADEDARVLGRDRHRIRLTPGITGPWQIKGPLHTPLSEMSMLDYRYASSWSIWQDIDILLKTVLRVFSRGGH